MRALPTFETREDEIRAVCQGEKAIAWFPMTSEEIDDYSDHDDVVALARTMGLSVVSCPRAVDERLPAGAPAVDVFVLRPAEMWRVNAFRASRETLGRYEWSDSSEYLYSFLLGYSEDSCKRWVAERRHNRIGWVGQTVYSLVQGADVERLESLAQRCFPSDFETSSRYVFAQPEGCLLRDDPERALPVDVFLCRFALSNDFFLHLFGALSQPEDEAVMSVQVGVDAKELNRQLVSAIEIWGEYGWRSRPVR